MQLFLIRHPPPKVATGVCYGQTDLELIEDANLAAQHLRPLLPAAAPVYSSPLSRCRLLAEALAPAPRIDPRLIEMNFGVWEMQPWADIDRSAMDAWAADPLGYAPPGGESPAALMLRVGEFHAALCEEQVATAVLVVHAGVMKALCGLLENLPAKEWMRLSFDFASVTVIENGRRLTT